MNNTARYILAGVLIFLIILLQPLYLKWLGYDGGYDNGEQNTSAQTFPDSGEVVEEKNLVEFFFEHEQFSKTFFDHLCRREIFPGIQKSYSENHPTSLKTLKDTQIRFLSFSFV